MMECNLRMKDRISNLNPMDSIDYFVSSFYNRDR